MGSTWRDHHGVSSRVLKSDRTGLTAALRYRFTGPVRPVTGGNRLNSNPNSNKFKNSHATGFDRFTGRFDRFTGRFDRFISRFNRFTDRFNRFTGWFDRFTGRFYRFEFKFKFKSSRATGLTAGLTGWTGGP